MRKIFFIDFDNTIFSHQTGLIPESAIKALKELQEQGHIFVIASGRPLRPDGAEVTKNDISPDCLAGANGALVYVGEKIIKQHCLDVDLKNRLMDHMIEKKYCVTAAYQGHWYISSMERLNEKRGEKNLTMPPSDSNFDALRELPIFSFFMWEGAEVGEELERLFPEVKILWMQEEKLAADIIPRDSGKVRGMETILEYYNASWEDTVAIGDSMNDIEMIKAAQIGIAMGNAMQATRDAADYVAAPIDEDGLADAIHYALTH